MKTLIKIFAFASVIILIAISCQKVLSNDSFSEEASGKMFNSAFVKNWYYGTFVKTSEWANSAKNDKKLPKWENGILTTIDKLEAVVYPLIKEISSFSIPDDKSLTMPQRKKVADASLSKIAFIKTNDNQIVVKEIDYIPDWQYLQNKQFSISEMKGVNGKSDFTGRVVIKDWGGNILSTQIQDDGKIVKIGKRISNASSTNSLEGCTYTEFCIWQMDCVVTVYGDGMVTEECGEWYNTGECWTEENCPEGGGGDDPQPCDPNAVSPQETEFNEYLVIQLASPITADAPISTDGPNPISGVWNWVVAEGAIANWKIKANTNYSYYHDKYYDANLNAFVHIYDLFNYQTVSSYFTGSNTFITSTWTQTSVLDQVLNNNTTITHGTSVVHGTIRHKLNMPLNLPYCGPLNLDQTVEVDPNTLTFNPK